MQIDEFMNGMMSRKKMINNNGAKITCNRLNALYMLHLFHHALHLNLSFSIYILILVQFILFKLVQPLHQGISSNYSSGFFYYAECFLGPFLWQQLMLKMTFRSKMKFCLVKMSLLFIKENIRKYKGKSATNLFCRLLLIE